MLAHRGDSILSIKKLVGCWVHERGATELALRVPGLGGDWQDLKNRHERISIDPISKGRVCHWADSSPLTVARLFPSVGARILRACLAQWPVSLETSDELPPITSPEVSFIIGVRGTRRLDQFRSVLKSIANQQDASIEIIVVEQSAGNDFQRLIPSHVRYLHTPLPHPQTPYNRSWALNAGATIARGRILVLHDADMLVPAGFAAAIAAVVQGEVEALRLPRLIFYMDQESSQAVQQTGRFDTVEEVERIVQNNPTPMAITREAYLRIGGHDESFYGWGGEDNEFLDRVRTLNVCEGAFLPIFHLWHEEAPNRSGDRNAAHLRSLLSIPACERIEGLVRRPLGQVHPSVSWTPPVDC